MNPRAAVNDLLPFQGSPFGQLGYFSKLSYMLSSVCQKRYLLYNIFFHFVKHYFKLFLQVFICLTNGESGIRTHAPLRTNGFQDRLVMTTSIPLQLIFHTDFVSAKCILPSLFFHVNILLQVFFCFSSFFRNSLFFIMISAISRSSGVVIFIFS